MYCRSCNREFERDGDYKTCPGCRTKKRKPGGRKAPRKSSEAMRRLFNPKFVRPA